MISAFFANVVAWVMSQQGIITLIGTAVLGFLVKKFPREKLYVLMKPFVIGAAIVVNNTLLKIFPRKLEIQVEEGIICTLTYCWRKAGEDFESKILEDNVIDSEKLKMKYGGTASAKGFSDKLQNGEKDKFDRVKW